MAMERSYKRIVSIMMAGFSVLSSQSVVESFHKLPIGGDNSPNFYAKEEKNSDQLSNTVNMKGLIEYTIDFGNYKNDFMINTILRNSGIKDEDGESLKADNIKDANTQENAIIITGAENFFKKEGEAGVSNLMRFSLKAEAEKTLTEIVKEFDEACTIHRDVFMKNSRMVNGELKEWSTNFQKERQEIKEEANKMVYFAELCLGALNNKIDIEKEDSDLQRIKNYIQFAKILNDAVECENNVATGEQSYKINTGKLAEYDGVINVDENAGIDGCLNCSMWASAFAICEIIDICIEQSELIKKIKQTNCYKQLSEVCNNLELGNEYDAIMNLTIDNWDCDYTREEIVKLVIADKNRSNKNQGYYNLKLLKKINLICLNGFIGSMFGQKKIHITPLTAE